MKHMGLSSEAFCGFNRTSVPFQWLSGKFRTMYCSAAVSYRPMIAEIGDAKQSSTKLAERACNQAILAAMDSEDETLQAQRDKACAAVQ